MYESAKAAARAAQNGTRVAATLVTSHDVPDLSGARTNLFGTRFWRGGRLRKRPRTQKAPDQRGGEGAGESRKVSITLSRAIS